MKSTSDLEFFEMFHQMRQRNVARAVIRYGKYMIARMEQLAAEDGYQEFKPHYIGILANIGPEGTTSGELARCIWVSKQAMSKMLKEVETQGFISSNPHEHDGRANIVRLTEKGRQLMTISLKINAQLKDEMTAIVGEEDVEHLINTMNKLLQDAEKKMGN
jgi:DNA-binding MarR family transcriptional regulator